MSQYAQPGAKRQKGRESKFDVDYFQGIEKIEYSKMASPADTSIYRYYNSGERVHSRTMEDWLKISISLTEFRGLNSEGRLMRPWNDNTNTIDNYKRCIKALYDLCVKSGIRYWTAFDTDLVPWSDNWDENKTNLDEVVDFMHDLSQKNHVKLLWLAPDLHFSQRYTSGALTSNDATTFIQAATQIKKCLEVSQRLNAECFLLWPYREGYDSIFQTDVAREIKLFAKLLKITAEYKDRLNYKCQLLIMPYYDGKYGGNNFYSQNWRRLLNLYMWDVTSCLYLLKSYNLERYYKVCTPPGHHMYMANVYNMLGGVTITNDVDQYDSKNLTLMMKCIVDQGTAPPGGINLKLTPRRDNDLRDILMIYMKYVDAIAKAFRLACNMNAEQVFSKHIQQRYSTYYTGFGSRLVSSDITMEECEECYKKNINQHSDATSKSEHIDVMFQRYLDTCDRI